MLLGEPAPTQADLHFKIFGFPVRVHPFFWLVALIIGARGRTELSLILCWIVAMFVSILVHELGHAVAVRRHGGQPWITLHGFGGLCSYNPISHNSMRSIIISFAGPLAGFFLLAFVLALVQASGHRVSSVPFLGTSIPYPVFEHFDSVPLTYFVSDMIWINLLWGLINLLPVYPLDGGQITRELCLIGNPHRGIVHSLWISIVVGAAIAIFGITKMDSAFMGIMFGFLAYGSWDTLQKYTGQGRW